MSGKYHHRVTLTTIMYLEQLQAFGLNQTEAKIYLALLELKEANITAIGKYTGVHRRNIYDTMERMLDKWIVFEIFEARERVFSPVDPSKLMELLREKETILSKVIPDLEKLFHKQNYDEAAYIYRGVEGYKHYMRDLVRIGEPVYFLWAKALWFSSNVEEYFLTSFQAAMKKKKLKYFTLFDYRVYEQIPKAIKKVAGEYKILPKNYSTPAVCDIAGEYVFIFNSADVWEWGEDGSVFVLKNKFLADSFRTWFQCIWDFCPSIEK